MQKIGFLVDHGVECRYFLLSGLVDRLKGRYEIKLYVRYPDCKILRKYAMQHNVNIQVLPPEVIRQGNFLRYARSVSNGRMRLRKLDVYSHSGKESTSKFYDFIFKSRIINIILNNFFIKLTRNNYTNEVLHEFFITEKLSKIYILQYDSNLSKWIGANCANLGIDVYIVMNSLKTVFIDNFLSFTFEKLFVWSENQKKMFCELNPNLQCEKIVALGSPYHTYLREEDDKIIKHVIRKYKINSERPLIVYSLINENIFKTEFQILELINRFLNEAFLENERPQLVIRRNPFEEYTSHIEKIGELNNVILAEHFWFRDAPNGWSIQDEEGEQEWKALLTQADLSMNIPSMATIDSIMCGTPVVNIGFDESGNFNSNLKHIVQAAFVQDFEKSPFVNSFNDFPSFKRELPNLILLKKFNNRENIISSIDISKSEIPSFVPFTIEKAI